MMRRCAYDAYLRKLCVDAHIMRRCANDAYMRRVCVYAHITRICAIRQRQQNVADSSRKRPRGKTLRIPRENGPGGRGLGPWHPSAPSLSCLVICCISKPQDPLTYLYLQARHAGPRGRRTSPACGSCRRPLKKGNNQGIETK